MNVVPIPVPRNGKAMKRKKTSIIRHRLHKDCKMCLRQRHMKEPLVKEMSEPLKTNVTLVNLNRSLPYLKEFTELSKKELVSIFNDGRLCNALTEYFDDISHLLDMLIKMKRMGGIN